MTDNFNLCTEDYQIKLNTFENQLSTYEQTDFKINQTLEMINSRNDDYNVMQLN